MKRRRRGEERDCQFKFCTVLNKLSFYGQLTSCFRLKSMNFVRWIFEP